MEKGERRTIFFPHLNFCDFYLISWFTDKKLLKIQCDVYCSTEISLPSSQFVLEIEDNSVSSFDAKTSIATGQQLGSTEIVLTDRSILHCHVLNVEQSLFVFALFIIM